MHIDSHQHFWRYNPAHQVWMTDQMGVLRRDYLPDELQPLLASIGFAGSIAVQARQMVEETEWLLELADQHDIICGVVGWVDLRSPEVDSQLEKYAAHPKLVGVRHVVHDEPDDNFMLRPEFRRGIARLRRHGLTYDLLLFPRHLPVALKLVEEFPEQGFVVDHIAKPDIRGSRVSPWKEDLERLARCGNVCCKLSGMVTEAAWKAWRPDDFRCYLDVVLGAFGPDRVMIGSDWPVCTLSGDYASTMHVVIDYIEQFPADARAGILGDNCARFYGLEQEIMKDTMLAAVLHGVRDLRVEELPIPEPPPGHVLLRIRRGGICGTDVHYFEEGRIGNFVVTAPFILGHEVTGEVVAVGDGVDRPCVGQRVVVNPSRQCGMCDYCRSGRGNLCRRVKMLGSASTKPPTHGGFCQCLAVGAEQCFAIGPEIDDSLAAMMEPFAVALHAARRAGPFAGKQVLVTGGGPIGLLAAIVARAFGAATVALSDPVECRRAMARKVGADAALDPTARSFGDEVAALTGDGFDVMFEASGAPPALRQAFEVVRRGGTVVQIGAYSASEIALPINQLMVREIQFLGSFRYGNVFEEGVRLLTAGRVNLRPLVSQVFPLAEAPAALEAACRREGVVKVQLDMA